MTIIQVVLILFVLFALSRAWLRFREKKMKLSEFIFWTVLWLAAIVAIALPDTLSTISTYAGIGRPVDLIIYVAIALLFYLVFRTYIILDKLNKDITTVVQEVAIKRAGKK